MTNTIFNIENKISKIKQLKTSSICTSFDVKNLKIEKNGRIKKYSGTIDHYWRNFFIEDIFIYEENETINCILINFINEEKTPIHTIRNTIIVRIILRSSAPKNIKFTKNGIVFYFFNFTIKIFYDIKTASSTLILQYKT